MKTRPVVKLQAEERVAQEEGVEETKKHGISADTRKAYTDALMQYGNAHKTFDDIVAFLLVLRKVQVALENAVQTIKDPAQREKQNRVNASRVYDKGSLQLKQQEFSKEPRITNLDAAEEKLQQQMRSSKSPTFYKKSTKAAETVKYSITFSDKEKLSFTQMELDDAAMRATVARKFDEKMLALQQQLSPRRP